MSIPGRKYEAQSGYRYGFNGKEKDNEIKGIGIQQDYGLRIYDSRIAKFLSVDPLTKSYPFYSPFQFAGNTPIQAIDLDGGEPWVRSTLRGVSEMRSAITAVSTSSTIESGFVLSFSQGLAVDPQGNVLMFSAAGGLAALRSGFSTNAGLSFTVNATFYNSNLKNLTQLLGKGGVGSYSGGWNEVISLSYTQEQFDDGTIIGDTYSIGLGYSGLPAGVNKQKTYATGVVLTGVEYDKVFNTRSNAETQGVRHASEQNYLQAKIAAEENGKPNSVDYGKALYMHTYVKTVLNYVPTNNGNKNEFEIVYENTFYVHRNNLVNPNGQETTYKTEFKTGVIVEKDADGNYISKNYNE